MTNRRPESWFLPQRQNLRHVSCRRRPSVEEGCPGSSRGDVMGFWDAALALPIGSLLVLFVALAIAFGFEFINGFHDTANAVTTVIYTRALRPTPAVVYS